MKVLLTTFGSLGDLHPYIAVGKGLRERGHAVTIATSEGYRAKVEGENLAFHALRPDVAGLIEDPESMRRAFHARTGTEYIVREVFLPFLEQSFEDTMAVARDADLIVGHPIAYATPIAAEVLGKRWISVALAPISMLSVYDPPVISGLPVVEMFRGFGPGYWRVFLSLAHRATRVWGEPINRLRGQVGLPAVRSPILADVFSPWGTQAWFSKVLAQPQPDWPVKTTITGFPLYDRLESGTGMSAELRQFLEAGPAPVVFTLGSSAVFDAGDFYPESAEAARIAGLRAVLLTGSDTRNRPAGVLGDSIFVTEYAPYSELLPHAAATVHQGGVGTTAQALRSGKPMIVMPYSHDQPDNARRMAKLGVARIVRRGKYRADRIARELQALLADRAYATAAARTAGTMATEDGVGAACDGLERLAGVS